MKLKIQHYKETSENYVTAKEYESTVDGYIQRLSNRIVEKMLTKGYGVSPYNGNIHLSHLETGASFRLIVEV